MKRDSRLLAVLVLGLIGILGCEDPGSITEATIEKPPPPGGGAPQDIAYVWLSSKTGYCIKSIAADGSNIGTITCPGGTFFTDISWEPAGTAVAYLVTTNPNYGLWRVNVNGSNTQQLLASGTYSGFDDLAWSSVGNEIAVTGDGPGGEPVLLLVPPTGCPWPNPSDPCPTVLYSEPSGTNHRFGSLAWSPDGTQIALHVMRGQGNEFIVLVERSTGVASDVRPWVGSVGDWGRGPRATTLVLAQFTGDGVDQSIYLFDLATPSVAPSLAVQHGRHPNFSADGEYIVYQETSGNFSMVKRELDTGTRTVLKAGGLHPNWRKP